MTRSEIILVTSSVIISLGGAFAAAVVSRIYPDDAGPIFWLGVALIVIGLFAIAGVFLRSHLRKDNTISDIVVPPHSTTFIDAQDVGSIASFGDKSSATKFVKVRRADSLTTFGSSHRPREK
jgi:hypothetical protein